MKEDDVSTAKRQDIDIGPFTIFAATVIFFSPNFLYFIPIFNNFYIFLVYNFLIYYMMISKIAHNIA